MGGVKMKFLNVKKRYLLPMVCIGVMVLSSVCFANALLPVDLVPADTRTALADVNADMLKTVTEQWTWALPVTLGFFGIGWGFKKSLKLIRKAANKAI